MSKIKLMVVAMVALLVQTSAIACWNDSECPNDKVCKCPSSSPTGNCSSAGKCVPDGRDWKSLKSELVNEKSSIKISNLKPEDIKYLGNSIETVSMRVDFKTGEPAPQYFTRKVSGKIVNVIDVKSQPPIWGVLKVSGIGTDIAIVEIRASGYPGQRASSTVTFQVVH